MTLSAVIKWCSEAASFPRPTSNGMRILQIGADRSKRGILSRGSPAYARQKAYAKQFRKLDIIGFSLRGDGVSEISDEELGIYPTNSFSKLFYIPDAIRIARALPAPEVVSVQDPFETGCIGWIVSKLRKAPLHVQVHTDFLSPEYARHSFLNRLRVFLAGFVLRRACGIRVVSTRVKDSLLKRYRLRAPIAVLPIFVDIGELQNARADDNTADKVKSYETKLLVVSRLEPEKNVALAIHAFRDAAPKNACLLIVGDGSERKKLERLAKNLGVLQRTFFEGSESPSRYYKLANLLLAPSLYEGYGMTIVEALASGIPVLSTDVGIAREAGAIVTLPEKFADALKEWFKSGPRTGELKNYPYKSFDEYIRLYCSDIMSCPVTSK